MQLGKLCFFFKKRRERVPAFPFPTVAVCGPSRKPISDAIDGDYSPWVVEATHTLANGDGFVG